MMVLPNSLKHSALMPWRQVLCNDEVKAALDALTQDPWISMPAYADSVFSLQLVDMGLFENVELIFPMK